MKPNYVEGKSIVARCREYLKCNNNEEVAKILGIEVDILEKLEESNKDYAGLIIKKMVSENNANPFWLICSCGEPDLDNISQVLQFFWRK